MLCYNGSMYNRLYLPTKDRRLAWNTYIKEQHWLIDFSDLRRVYRDLFEYWDDPKKWTEQESFLDSHY